MSDTNRSTPVTDSTELNVGDAVQANWHGSWWPAEVVALEEGGQVRIHYSGWDASWDETVDRSRLALGAAPVVTFESAAVPAAPALGPLYYHGVDRIVFGDPVTRETSLHAGQAVHVRWGNSWWSAEVLAVNADDTVRIHYTSWSSGWDETVTRSRVQLPASRDRSVTIHLERGWSIKGTVLDVTPDGYVVSRAEDHKVCMVNRYSVKYVEIDNAPRGYSEGIRSF